MTTTDLERLGRLYPGAVGRGVIQGSQHAVRSQLKVWEARGEVVGLRRFERENRTLGTTAIPYVRLKTLEQVRREKLKRAAVLAGVGLVAAGALCWVAWQARYVIAATVGMIVAAWLFFLIWPHWSRGCSGLHCSGCKG